MYNYRWKNVVDAFSSVQLSAWRKEDPKLCGSSNRPNPNHNHNPNPNPTFNTHTILQTFEPMDLHRTSIASTSLKSSCIQGSSEAGLFFLEAPAFRMLDPSNGMASSTFLGTSGLAKNHLKRISQALGTLMIPQCLQPASNPSRWPRAGDPCVSRYIMEGLR